MKKLHSVCSEVPTPVGSLQVGLGGIVLFPSKSEWKEKGRVIFIKMCSPISFFPDEPNGSLQSGKVPSPPVSVRVLLDEVALNWLTLRKADCLYQVGGPYPIS